MSEGTESPAAEHSASADALGNFETTLDALEALVEQLESGDLSLEAALGAFEQGIALTRQCQKVLSVAAPARARTAVSAPSMAGRCAASQASKGSRLKGRR